MRSDNKLSAKFRDSGDWLIDPVTGKRKPQIDRLKHYYGADYHRHSYSGNERNRLFINVQQGSTFVDISGVSGLDTSADSRSWCLLDFDHDGWQDVALVNANTPLLNLFRNRIGGLAGNTTQTRFLAIRLVGGNSSSKPSEKGSNRDGIGAVITVKTGNRTIRRARRCGEGFAAQNSATTIIGLGALEEGKPEAISLTIRWPSGAVHKLEQVDAGKLVTVFERAEDSKNGKHFSAQSYR